MTAPRVCPHCDALLERGVRYCAFCYREVGRVPRVLAGLVRTMEESDRYIREHSGPVGILGWFGVRTHV